VNTGSHGNEFDAEGMDASARNTPRGESRKFDLVIFDCDGVLVDTEVISCRAHVEVLTRHGYPVTEQQVLERFLGVSDRQARLIVEAEMSRSLPADFEAQVEGATLRCYAGDFIRRRSHRRDRPAQMRARLSRRQSLPARLCRDPARRRRPRDI
jgi:beta-phosphoglucomutase-like phosphatase (HAD superfamily)